MTNKKRNHMMAGYHYQVINLTKTNTYFLSMNNTFLKYYLYLKNIIYNKRVLFILKEYNLYSKSILFDIVILNAFFLN